MPPGDERRLSFERISQLVDRAEGQGGFITVNNDVKVGDIRLNLIDSLRFREQMMSRQRERETDKSADYKAAQAQGYRAAVNDMRFALDGIAPR